METLPSDSRQPPDGHEFPDYVENVNNEDLYRPRPKSVHSSQTRSSFNDYLNLPMQKSSLTKASSVSNSDLTEAFDNQQLHVRSQSLIDVSAISRQKGDRWSLLAEQRKRGYSKLKGLVIPEHVTESESAAAVNIPEIISNTASIAIETTASGNDKVQSVSGELEPVALPLTSPPWSSTTNAIPKYSPAFKRKSLQVYSQPKANKQEEPQPKSSVPDKAARLKHKLDNDELRLDNLSDSPKSLESITSPTRSDCSFDYVTNSFKSKYTTKTKTLSKLHKDLGKSEDESDNDSAVSSSQSSYISRCSPPPSPTRSCETLDYDSNGPTRMETMQFTNIQSRLLKAASVEAINRKNILASAKCRSGKDLKVGSPVIQRKYEDDTPPAELAVPPPPATSPPSLKDMRSISCEEPVTKIVLNGDTDKNGTTEMNPFKNLPAQLRETKIPPKAPVTKPSSLMKANKSMSVTDLRKNFEKFGSAPPPMPHNPPSPTVNKEIKLQVEEKSKKPERPVQTKKLNDITAEAVEPAATVPSKIEIPKVGEVDPKENARTLTLCPEFVGGSVGITLAGGTDYETKEITVHRIRYGSAAYNDGTLKKGDKILSINGKLTTGLTHAEAVEMLKEPVAQFVLLVEDGKEEALDPPKRKSSLPVSPRRKSSLYEVPEQKNVNTPEPSAKKVTHTIVVAKEGAGLGFSIEGGKDSPQGDLPLRIKKIFQGGNAEKNGALCVGDELLAINDISLTNLSRIETWSLMKKLPDGDVSIHIYR